MGQTSEFAHQNAVAGLGALDVYAAAQERGRARDVDETMRELLAELEGDLPAL